MKTKEKILEAAKKEFIEKGYANASMRNIASQVGISATALYRHYANKEEIFDAVVGPAVSKWNSFCDSEKIRQADIARDQGLDAMWDDERRFDQVVDMIYEDFELQKLLFCGSEETKYSNFLHDLITKVQQYTLSFMEDLKRAGIHVNQVDEEEMHLLLSAQYSAIIEMIEHDFPYQKAKHYAETISMFYTEGWRKFLGF